MKDVMLLPDGFKRRYMLSAFKAMMKDFHKHFDFGGAPIPHDMPGLDALKKVIDA
jgi:hypothetical protein